MLSPQASQIRQMFSSIASRYDFLNHLLSFNIDRSWRRRTASLVTDTLVDHQALCLDLCCGTGDLTLEIIKQAPTKIVSADFSHPMLKLNLEKVTRQQLDGRILILETDAMHLPFRENTFDALTIAFGLRNLESWSRGLKEMFRVLKPEGQIFILEFSRPNNSFFNRAFQFYFLRVLPEIGSRISRHRHAYRYLQDSVSQFPDQARLSELMLESGFVKISYENLTGGIAAIHIGNKT